jgi:hypothetical protein
MAQSSYNDLQNACGGRPCPSSKCSEIDSGKTDVLLANVGLVVGIAGVAAAGTLFVLSLPKHAPVSNVGLVLSPSGIGVTGWMQ